MNDFSSWEIECWAHGALAMRVAVLELMNDVAAQTPVLKIPEGWQLVPKEPTDDMRIACIHANYFSEIDADWKAMLAAAPALQAPVREVPEGWKLVPVEPTETMLEAIEDAAKAECSIEWDSQLGGNLHFGDPSRVYADMLAAAPLPAAPVQKGGE